jgi:hypothetical protein
MMRRRVSRVEALAVMLLLCLAGRARAQAGNGAGETPERKVSGDPNLPNERGDIAFAPNSLGAARLAYTYHSGRNNPPEVQLVIGIRYHPVDYVGFNDEGTWLGTYGSSGYLTVKGHTLTVHPRGAPLPRNLRNGSPDYVAWVGGSQSKEDSAPEAAPSSRTSRQIPPPEEPSARPSRPAAAPGATTGTDAKIERGARGATLHFRDAKGEHSYTVRRPATAAAAADTIETGAWLHVAPDGKSGILFNVSANHSVLATPLAGPMLGMLAGHGVK